MHFFRKSKPKEKKAWVIEEVHENLEYNSDDSNAGDNDDGGTRKGKNDRIPMLSIQSNTNNDNDNDTDNAYATTHHSNNQNSIINSPVKMKQKQKKKKKKWQQTMPLENKIEKAQAEEERSIIQYPGFMKLQYKSGAGQLGGGKKPTNRKTKIQPSTTTHREASELTCIRSNRTNDNESMDDTSISRLSLTSSTTTATELETVALSRTPSVPAWTYATRQDYEAQLSDNVNIASLSYWTGGLIGESNKDNNINKDNNNKDKNSVTMPANDNVIDVGSSSSSSGSPNTNTRSSNITNTNGDILTAEKASVTHDESVPTTFFTSPFLDRTSSSSLRSIPEEEDEDNEEEEDEEENQDVKALQEKLCALHNKIAVATEAAKQRVKEKHKNNTIELVLVEAEVQGGPLSTNCYGPHFLGNTSLGAPQPQQPQQQSPSPLITLPAATAPTHKLKFVGALKKQKQIVSTHKSVLNATTIVSCSSTTTSLPPSIIVEPPSNSLITCTSQEFYSQEDDGGSNILESVAALKSVLTNNNVFAEENYTNTEERKVKTQEDNGGSIFLDSVAALKSVLSNNNVSAAEENHTTTVGSVIVVDSSEERKMETTSEKMKRWSSSITSRNNTTTKDHRGSTIIQPGVVDAVATTTSLLESINRISNIMCAQCTPISPEKKKQYGDYNDIAEEEEDRDDVDDTGDSSSIVNILSETRYCQPRKEVAVVEDHDNYDIRIIASAATHEDQYYDNVDDRDDVDDDNNNDRRNSAEMEGEEAVNQPIVGSSSTSTSTSSSSSSSSSSSPDATPEQQQIRSLQKTIEELKASLQPNTKSSPDEEPSSTTSTTPTPTPTPPPPPTPPTPTPTPLLQPLLVRNHDTRNEAAWKRCAPRSQCDQKTKAVIQFPIPKKIFSPNETDDKKGMNSNDKKGVNNTNKEGSSRSSLWYTNFFERFPSLDGMSKTKNAVVAATTTTTTTTGEILESSE